MKKEYISDVWQLKQKGHENFEFVDVQGCIECINDNVGNNLYCCGA